jgi:MYXO-CTERM domain-containing protein
MKTRWRKPASISYSRWAAYAAAGVASTACASSAEAEIHYSGLVNHNFANGGFAGPLDPGVTLELGVGTGTWVGGGSFSFGAINIRGPSHSTLGAFVGYAGLFAYFWLSELPAGAFLPRQPFGNSCRWSSSCGCQVCYGAQFGGPEFRDPGTGFVGFSFSHDGRGIQYGWARVKKSGPPDYRFRLVDYAWGDPGDRIRTGQKTSAGNTVDGATDSASIGLLALGAAGLVAWRKRRGQATQ